MNPKEEITFDDPTYRKLIVELKAKTGVGLEGYRVGVAQRRIARRARDVGCKSFVEYFRYLQNNSSEAEELARLVTLPVGRFFRNREVFDAIERDVLPRILGKARQPAEAIIWCAGCGEGEEPYSVAILISNCFSIGQTGVTSDLNHMIKSPCEIIGTDVNSGALEKARMAHYENGAFAEVLPSIKRRCFVEDDGGWQLKNGIREMVKFRRESLPDGKGVRDSDLVLLRNLLIYFDREKQDMILKKVVSCLKTGGFLVLGKAETLPAGFRKHFDALSSTHRIYRKVT